MESVQIIHVSDFHLDSNPISVKKEQLINALISDLKKQKIDTKNCIFVISGDLVDKGGRNFSSTRDAFYYFKEVFVDRLKNELSIGNEQFFFVPGNHDVDRGKVDPIIETGILSSVSSINGINDFILKNISVPLK